MNNGFSRSELLLGKDKIEKLNKSRVAVFGLGGVGGYVVETLTRAGIGALDLIDNDVFTETNLNRQILATVDTIGKFKADVAKERVLLINPNCDVRVFKTFFLPETKDEFDFKNYDYVVDAIDTITGKKEIILCAFKAGVPVISSMGTGNKFNPAAFKVADIYKTSVCPLAKVMRGICRKNGIEKLKVVYSEEKPYKLSDSAKAELLSELDRTEQDGRKDIPASLPFAPAAAGILIASEVVKDLVGLNF